jgi:hypothetical protein
LAQADSPLVKVGRDFTSYWSSARLLVNGENPYSVGRITSLQQSVGQNYIVISYSPPWLLPFFLPFSVGNYVLSKCLWILIMAGLVVTCSFLLWNIYGGRARNRYWSLIILIFFFPYYVVLQLGQVVPLVLIGLVGFLYFVEKRQWWVASLFTAFLALKPQTLYLFWVALFFWIIENKDWKFALKILVVNVSLLSIPLIFNPQVYSQYFHAVSDQSFAYEYATPTIGTYLRLIFGGEKHWLQFVSVAASISWFLFYWFKERKQWEWKQMIPWMLFVSLITTFYVWYCDYLLILIALIQTAVWMTNEDISAKFKITVIIFFLIFNILAFIHTFAYTHYLIWFPVVLFFFYYSVRKVALR